MIFFCLVLFTKSSLLEDPTEEGDGEEESEESLNMKRWVHVPATPIVVALSVMVQTVFTLPLQISLSTECSRETGEALPRVAEVGTGRLVHVPNINLLVQLFSIVTF